MGSLANQKPWVPYMNTKDCSQGFCSLYCPQWCYIIFPPPPPFEFPDDSSGPNFSPIVIVILGILGSAFLLVSYYAIISKYCKNRESSRRRENHFPIVESEENQDPSNHELWHGSANGLDEDLIKSLQIFKYRKGDGLIEGTDCSVCLSEFQDDESFRLLPKCNHAFHVICIDTWLKSHSNCPLCRANIAFVNASSPPQLPLVVESPLRHESSLHSNPGIENVASEEDLERGSREAESQSNFANISRRQGNDLGTSDDQSRLSGIRIDEGEQMRRSVSMDCISQGRLSIADILRIDQDEEDQIMEGTSKQPNVEMRRSNNRNRLLHCISSPAILKRSFSSGRFLLPKGGRGRRNIVIPL